MCMSKITTALMLIATYAIGGEIPDPKLTPGVIASTDELEVCGVVDGLTYSKRHRVTPKELKDKVYANYGIKPDGKTYEIDHRLPLALGGADVEQNLWPQNWMGYCGAHAKDKIEVDLWKKVCHEHSMKLAEAQAILLGDYWTRLKNCIP